PPEHPASPSVPTAATAIAAAQVFRAFMAVLLFECDALTASITVVHADFGRNVTGCQSLSITFYMSSWRDRRDDRASVGKS
ncbi:hypothetical protein, partial [Microbacterium gubbeenense]|uniref:hypothetical protein n=1 Tax=Microbacterium gubbeenense TaxID=159896 RepID=UPI003F9C67C3